MKSPTKQNLSKLSHTKQIYFAIFCAKQVLHLVEPKHKEAATRAIETAIAYTEGKATKEDCNAAYAAYAAADAAADAAAAAAAYAAADAAAAAAAYAAYAADAAYAAYAAAAAAASDKQTIIEAQWIYYDMLLNTDKYFEEIVLESK
jgi:hypothetical protein